MEIAEFDYHLPTELIAQNPVEPRDASRLMVVERTSGEIRHHAFRELAGLLEPEDLLVANDTRVLPARLYGRKETGGRVELLLLRRREACLWEALVGGKRLRPGTRLKITEGGPWAVVVEDLGEAQRLIRFEAPITPVLERVGHTPLPPYIHQQPADPERYQTIYAREQGSSAAPTAGLHFTPELLLALRERGIGWVTCTLHIGLDTFKPLSGPDVESHTLHSEWARLSPEAARRINQARLAGGRIVAVGTTAARTLETAALRSAGMAGSLRQASALPVEACPWRGVSAFEGDTDLFIYPGYRFRAVDALLTNFHLPRSSLLLLVSAFAGVELIRRAYREAVDRRYRFYSFGDAMLIL